MYHISNDKRAVQSADLIYNGLLQCLEKKSFDQITVTDVQKAVGLGREAGFDVVKAAACQILIDAFLDKVACASCFILHDIIPLIIYMI